MTEEWLSEIENFGQRRERILEEIEHVLSRFGGDIMDNAGDGRYLSSHIYELLVRWAEGAMQHEREKNAQEVESWRGAQLLLHAGEMSGRELLTVDIVTKGIARVIRSKTKD